MRWCILSIGQGAPSTQSNAQGLTFSSHQVTPTSAYSCTVAASTWLLPIVLPMWTMSKGASDSR